MDLQADATLPFPRPLVFATYRDKLPEMVSYFPNVRGIEVKSRSDNGAVADIVNIWHGGGEIPAAARAFISEAALSWTDHARWDGEAWTTEWRIETHAFAEAVTCKGVNRYLAEGDTTRFELRGTLTIDATKIKGVPRLLSGKVARVLEEFLGNKIRPNLVEVTQGVGKYIAAQKA